MLRRFGETERTSARDDWGRRKTHESIVTLPSLPKIRWSEFVVALVPTTNGFRVVPLIYSVALHRIFKVAICVRSTDAHVVVKARASRIKVRYRFNIVWVIQFRHNIWEWIVLDATKSVSGNDDSALEVVPCEVRTRMRRGRSSLPL